VYSPQTLKDKWDLHSKIFPIQVFYFKGFIGSAADFGYNPYGKVVFGSVHLAKPLNACEPIITPTFDE